MEFAVQRKYTVKYRIKEIKTKKNKWERKENRIKKH